MKPQAFGRAFLVVAAIALAPILAHAQSPKNPEALQLYQHGKKLIDQQKYKQACAALKQSLDIEEAINTLYQFGRCNESQDRYLEAHDAYLRASTMARTAGDQKRAGIAQQRADDLKPKIPKLVVLVNSSVPSLSITWGDKSIPQADWGKAVPIDPGEHTVKASAPGYQEWSMTISAQRTGGVSKVTIPELVPSTSAASDQPPPPPPVAPPPPPPGDGEEYTGPTERRSTGMFITGVILIPVGGLALLAAPIVYGVDVAESGGVSSDPGPLPIALAIFGVAAIGAGIPLLVIGNQDVPVENAAQPPPPQAAVHVGPGSMSISGTF